MMIDYTDEDASLHDAHVVQWNDKRASDDDAFFERQHNFTGALGRSTIAEDYDLTGDDIARIDFALNEYHVERDDDHIEAMRTAKTLIRNDLKKAHGALNAAVLAFAAIEKNPYALSALHAACNRDIQPTPDTLGNVERLAQMVESLRQLAPIVEQAQQQQEFSNGLPAFQEGAPPDPSFEMLIFRLRGTLEDVASRAPEGMNQSTRAECIVEILAIANVRTRKGTPYIKKTIENWLSRMDETFPKIKVLETPANRPKA